LDTQPEYITKDIAAKLLGVMPRRALELADEGKIRKLESYNPETRRRQTVLLTRDVKRLAMERRPRPKATQLPTVPTSDSGRAWLRLSEVALLWDVSEGAVLALIRAGDLPARKFACRRDPWRVHRADLDALRGARQEPQAMIKMIPQSA